MKTAQWLMRAAAVFLLLVGAVHARLTRTRPMHWEASGPEGWEQSHYSSTAPNGGVTYVRRRLHTDFCEFGDFPDEVDPPPITRVACGDTWTNFYETFSLTCECARPLDAR